MTYACIYLTYSLKGAKWDISFIPLLNNNRYSVHILFCQLKICSKYFTLNSDKPKSVSKLGYLFIVDLNTCKRSSYYISRPVLVIPFLVRGKTRFPVSLNWCYAMCLFLAFRYQNLLQKQMFDVCFYGWACHFPVQSALYNVQFSQTQSRLINSQIICSQLPDT